MLEQLISLAQTLPAKDVINLLSDIEKFQVNMWPRNDGTFVTPHGQQVPQQVLKQPGAIPSSSDPNRMKNGDNSNAHARNGDYDPDDDEIDYSDSEFDEDCSEFDEEDSELENEIAITSQLLMQKQANVYAPNLAHQLNMASVSNAAQDSSNYSALNALSQMSTSVAPNYGMQVPNVDPANHSAMIAALTQLSASGAPKPNVQMQSQQNVKSPNQTAVNVMGQHAASMAQWQHAQQAALHAHYMQQNQARLMNGHKSGDINANNKIENNEKKEEKKVVPNNFRNSTPNRMSTRGGGVGGPIRPRTGPPRCRIEPGVDLFQLRRREFEETFTTEDDSTSSSPIKDITAKLKHLKILKLFRRNKTSRENLVTMSSINPDIPILRDSNNCNDTSQDEGKSQLQKISEVLLKPSEKTWNNNNEHNADNQSNLMANRSSSYEKSIQAFLFRSNFPEHFLAIRLLQLSIEDVQQLIRQIDLLENVQDKLTETVRSESLSGPALMSCDLNELKKSLDLNLGHWTIFEQLITGLRNIQYDEFLKLNIEKQVKLSQEIHDSALDDPNSRCSSLSSESHSQPIIEQPRKIEPSEGKSDVKQTAGVGAQNSSPTALQ